MLDGISFGQYFPGTSPIHRLDARTKILLTLGLLVALFLPDGFAALGLLAVFTVAVYLISRVPLRLALRSVRALIPILIFMTLLNVLYLPGEHVLWQWWVFSVSTEGIKKAIFMALRIVLLLVTTSLLTYTTSPIDLTDGLERLLSPLKVIKVPVHDLAMIMNIALRFIPTLLEEAQKIMAAQKARGADLESGSLTKRVKALIPILVPLLVSAVRRATELAVAMDCRCYQGGQGRTRMKQSKLGIGDLLAFVAFVLLTAAVLVLDHLVRF